MAEQKVHLDISLAHDERDAISALWPRALSYRPPIVIAAAHDASIPLARTVCSHVEHAHSGPIDVEVVSPPALATMTLRRLRQRAERSTPVDLSHYASRLSSVRIMSSVATANTVIAVNDLRFEKGLRPTIAIGIWGRYTDVRDRLGFRLSAADKGAAAEIALAVQPALVVIVEQIQGHVVAFATTDQLVAELAGLAVKQIKDDVAVEPVGPWEDPLVQRATELDLGVRLPSLIAIRGRIASGPTGASREAVTWLSDAIALKLGVTDVSVE